MSDNLFEILVGKLTRPVRDEEKNSESAKSNIEKSPDQEAGIAARGLNNDPSAEPAPRFEPSAAEKVLSNNTNASIVLGKDRPSNIASGYGGMGATGAGAIDIVAGRKPLDPSLYIDPNFITDAARIQVSQTTDIDKNFNLAKGQVGASKGRSGIGLKADGVRVVAREGIKLVTEGRGTDNSQGGKIRSTVGIDLIAGNYTSDFGRTPFLQPMVKGYELVNALKEMMDLMDDLSAMVAALATGQKLTNTILARHEHISGAPGTPTVRPQPFDPISLGCQTANILLVTRVIAPMKLHRTNTTAFRINTLQDGSPDWICSRHNNVN